NQMNLDSISSSKPFIEAPGGEFYLYKRFCDTRGKYKVFVQIITENSININFRYKVENIDFDKWSFPTTAEFIRVAGSAKSGDHTFSCEGILSKASCKNIIKDHYPMYRYGQLIDTAIYGGYMVVEADLSGILEVIQNRSTSHNVYVKLFKGDIRTSCNLKEIKDTVMSWRSRIRHCVEKGEVYSLLIGSSKIGQGSRVGFDLYITPKSFTEKYFYHTEPEKMPSFNYTHGAKLSSELVAYNRFADTTIQIDNMKFSGLMHFREI